VPGLAATIALAGASHGALLDYAYLGNVGVLAASSQRGVTRSARISRIPRRAATSRPRLK